MLWGQTVRQRSRIRAATAPTGESRRAARASIARNLKGRCLSFAEREEIALARAGGDTMR